MKTTLKKILTELNSENPRLDYIKGMLEVLIGEDEPPVAFINKSNDVQEFGTGKIIPMETSFTDEAAILDAKAKAHIERFGMPTQSE